MEREKRGDIGLAEDFADRGILVQKVDGNFQPVGDYLVIESAPVSRLTGDLVLVREINAKRVETRGDIPQVLEGNVVVIPHELVEFIGRFDIDKE